MGWFASLFGTGKAVEAIASAADAAHFSAQEKAEQDASDTQAAREFAPPPPASERVWFDVLVDGFNRIPRPYITAYVFGGLSGWWTLPDPAQIPPFWQSVALLVLTFWFGGRALLRDLPAAVLALMKARGRA